MSRELDVHNLRALIRLIPAVRTLREDVEKSIHLETFHGTGDLVIETFRNLRDRVVDITQNDHIARIDIRVNDAMGDREKVSQAMLASGQLLAYIEAETGLTGIATDRRGNYSVQTAPNIQLDMGDVIGGQVDRVMDIVRDAMRGIPQPPKPPKAPRPEKRKRREMWDHPNFPFNMGDEDEDDDQ